MASAMDRDGDEFGIFSSEGILEGGFYSRAEADAAVVKRYAADAAEGEAIVHPCCHDHPEHARDTCELCNEDEEEAKDGEDETDE
jgi:hypothetical protein